MPSAARLGSVGAGVRPQGQSSETHQARPRPSSYLPRQRPHCRPQKPAPSELRAGGQGRVPPTSHIPLLRDEPGARSGASRVPWNPPAGTVLEGLRHAEERGWRRAGRPVWTKLPWPLQLPCGKNRQGWGWRGKAVPASPNHACGWKAAAGPRHDVLSGAGPRHPSGQRQPRVQGPPSRAKPDPNETPGAVW